MAADGQGQHTGQHTGQRGGATAAVVDVNGRSDYTISDGLLEITADVAGEILVTLNLWPFLEARFEITAA